MTAFYPIGSHQAAAFVEKAGGPEARRIMVDLAAAGLLRAYACAVEMVDRQGTTTTVRDAPLPTALWHRIVAQGMTEDLWSGGTVRLRGSDPDGLPAVSITGIGFSTHFVHRVVDRCRDEPGPPD